LTVLPIPGIGDVRPGDDLAALITNAAPWLADGDVLVVTSKIVSKAEGRLVALPADGPERDAARDAVLDQETARVVARRGQTRIVQTHHGFVLASAGIDASNVDKEHLVLLPTDPDASARELRAALREGYHLDVAVVISDTMGRPWRTGLTDVALGAAGIEAVHDYRGEVDAYGNELQVTQVAVVDELAGAAELVKGKYDQVPVAVIRGLHLTGAPDGPGAGVLVRSADQDMFSLGTAEARADGLRRAAVLSDVDDLATVPVGPAVVRRALDLIGSAALTVLDAGVRDKLRDEFPGLPGGELVHVHAEADPISCARAGAELHRLRAALAAEGLASAWLIVAPGELVELPAGEASLGLLAVGYPG
jgi:coenzyme F420-0:L-glutamate ligase/coenzyme F420-1:gamma-L-glutamate ligase